MSAGAIPAIKGISEEVAKPLRAIKENIEEMRGRLPKQAKIKELPANASTAQIINKVNELLELLQG